MALCVGNATQEGAAESVGVAPIWRMPYVAHVRTGIGVGPDARRLEVYATMSVMSHATTPKYSRA